MVITREHTLAGNRFAALATFSSEDEQQVPETYQFRPIAVPSDAQMVPSLEAIGVPEEPRLEVIDLTGDDDEESDSRGSLSDELITDEELQPSIPRKRRRDDVEADVDDEIEDSERNGYLAYADALRFSERSRRDNAVFSNQDQRTRHAHFYSRWHQAKQLKKAGDMLMQLYELPSLDEDALLAEERLLEFVYDRVFDLQN